MTHSFLLFVIYALCVFRLTHLITDDSITASAREWLRAKSHESQVRTVYERGNEKLEERVGEKPGALLWMWKLASCAWCVSVWIGAVVVVIAYYQGAWFQYVCAAFALSGFVGIVSEKL